MIRGGMSAARLRRAIWAGREPLARALLVIAILAAIAAPANALETPSPELRRVVSAGDPEWTVVWQATTAEEHGQFRLYGGPALESLQLVDIQPAALGPAGYRYRDERSGVPGWYYQLRYLNSKGEELVLGSLRVEPVGLQSTPASIHQSGAGGQGAALHRAAARARLAPAAAGRRRDGGRQRQARA